jgi:hypothetical protein
LAQLVERSDRARQDLLERYWPKIEVNPALSRSIVSYQSNKNLPFYRWFKYKEGFSAALVEYLLTHFRQQAGDLLDPFMGAGASLFAARDHGVSSMGIEVLPLGPKVVEARLLADTINPNSFRKIARDFAKGNWQGKIDAKCRFSHLRITQDAFPETTEAHLNQFRTWVKNKLGDGAAASLLELACLNVLEGISYTRKDGQYLRWDARSPRTLRGKPFNKGEIVDFCAAMQQQLQIMADDLSGMQLLDRSAQSTVAPVRVCEGSCLDVLSSHVSHSFDMIITSPPYCNRYDYTRTYALELAYLGVDENRLRELRQALLTCTVENKSKVETLALNYRKRGNGHLFDAAIDAFENQTALHEVLDILDDLGRTGQMNNTNVPRMVRNYFLESAVVVFELARLIRPGGRVVMVNDNVQYGGEEVPVDLILCDFAAKAGLTVEHIWVLGRGKGNSSQQMGAHGRNELRKCAYVWRMN